MPSSEYFMAIAQAIAAGSKCKRRQVGAIIVNPLGQILSTGYNGTPRGTDNTCEDCQGKTLPTVLHAELNAILFAREDVRGCIMYVTCAPCAHCAAVIAQKGISRVVYAEEYSSDAGIEMLRQLGIAVTKK